MMARVTLIWRLLVGLTFLALLLAGLHACSTVRSAKTETRLARGQADAAVQSGSDAVATVGQRQAQDAASQQVVEETKHEIAKATDAATVTGAGLDGLCRLDGYKRRPECVR